MQSFVFSFSLALLERLAVTRREQSAHAAAQHWLQEAYSR